MSRKSFTLIELITAVSILSIGLVAIVRSFLNIQGALNTLENRTEAVYFLESAMADILTMLEVQDTLDGSDDNGDIRFNNGPARWQRQTAIVEESGDKEQVLEEMKLSLFWKESGKEKSLAFSRYVIVDKADK